MRILSNLSPAYEQSVSCMGRQIPFKPVQMAPAYRLDAIAKGPKNSRIPGPNPLPLPLVMDMRASKTLCTGLYKSQVHKQLQPGVFNKIQQFSKSIWVRGRGAQDGHGFIVNMVQFQVGPQEAVFSLPADLVQIGPNVGGSCQDKGGIIPPPPFNPFPHQLPPFYNPSSNSLQ